jgi:hypothetical protein
MRAFIIFIILEIPTSAQWCMMGLTRPLVVFTNLILLDHVSPSPSFLPGFGQIKSVYQTKIVDAG